MLDSSYDRFFNLCQRKKQRKRKKSTATHTHSTDRCHTTYVGRRYYSRFGMRGSLSPSFVWIRIEFEVTFESGDRQSSRSATPPPRPPVNKACSLRPNISCLPPDVAARSCKGTPRTTHPNKLKPSMKVGHQQQLLTGALIGSLPNPPPPSPHGLPSEAVRLPHPPNICAIDVCVGSGGLTDSRRPPFVVTCSMSTLTSVGHQGTVPIITTVVTSSDQIGVKNLLVGVMHSLVAHTSMCGHACYHSLNRALTHSTGF